MYITFNLFLSYSPLTTKQTSLRWAEKEQDQSGHDPWNYLWSVIFVIFVIIALLFAFHPDEAQEIFVRSSVVEEPFSLLIGAFFKQ